MKVEEKTLGEKAVTTVAWISDFPVEWLPDIPLSLHSLPKQHPGTWQMVLLSELEKNPALRIHVIILRKQIDKDFSFERNGVIFHILKVPGGWRAPTFFWLDTILIRRVLEKIKPDLIHAWGTERGAALICSRLKYRYVVTIQGLLTWYKQLVPLTAHERFATAIEELSLKRAKLATTESTFAVQFLQKKYPRLQVHQAEHAPNWLFHRTERRPQTKPIRFISIATLGYRKGTDLLLRALDELSCEMNFELVLISGPNQTYLESLKRTLSPEFWKRITFKTHLLPVDVAGELSVATMLLLPTRADTSPNAVKEAVVAGVPVIASKIGGIVDYVYHGKNGLLVSSNDLPGFVQSIRDAVQNPLFSQGLVDPETLQHTRKYLSPETMDRRFMEAYEQLLKRETF
jgi:glycosyltransferase involved in cell wall biosynthesis